MERKTGRRPRLRSSRFNFRLRCSQFLEHSFNFIQGGGFFNFIMSRLRFPAVKSKSKSRRSIWLTAPYLAEDLLEEILSWLPVKSLARFKCVKKSWSSTSFQNPSFIAKHHRHRSQTNLNFVVANFSYDAPFVLSLHPHPENNNVDDSEGARIVEDLKESVGVANHLHRIDMFTCINGIICVGGSFFEGVHGVGDYFYSKFYEGFFLWNPATRESKVVPYPKLPDCPSHLAIEPSHWNPIVRYAFGHDHNSNDYKVVRLVNYKGRYEGNVQSCNFVHVYNLNTGFWRQITNSAISRSAITLLSHCDYAYLNGVHHWCGFSFDNGSNKYSEVIVSFDMSSEVFGLIRLPDGLFNKQNLPKRDTNVSFMKRLALFNNCLAFIVFNVQWDIAEKYFHIWVMREYGVEDSWTKQLVVGPLFGIQTLLWFAKNEELILCCDDEDNTIVMYNIHSQETKNLQHSGLPNSFCPWFVSPYAESLVSLN